MFTSNNDDEAETWCLGQNMWTVRPAHLQRELEVCWYTFTVVDLLGKVSYTRVD